MAPPEITPVDSVVGSFVTFTSQDNDWLESYHSLSVRLPSGITHTNIRRDVTDDIINSRMTASEPMVMIFTFSAHGYEDAEVTVNVTESY